jgi:hypothetical protein
MALLSIAEYPAIRASIDISLDSTTLPDAIIALDIYSGAGQRDVLALDPLAESRTGDALIHATNAAILFTAARLVTALPQILKETFPDHSYERKAYDQASMAAQLRASAGAEMDAYLDIGALSSDLPTTFATASARRGRW